MSACDRLAQSLKSLDVPTLPISEYNKKYLGRYLRDIPGTLQLYSFLLTWSLGENAKPLGDRVLVDYGGGTGILSLLARLAGIGRVLYCDIYGVSCRDARTIGERLGCAADEYIEGDASTVRAYLTAKAWECDTVVSMNTIEHIYDVPAFLQELAEFPGPNLTLLLASSANPLNPRTDFLTKRLQRRNELHDRRKNWGSKPRDTTRSFLALRREIIRERYPDLGTATLDQLASATRGRMLPDILEAVEVWKKDGRLPVPPNHPTNTCDPLTGNWCEQLMNPHGLADILRRRSFVTEVFGGPYPGYPNRPIKALFTSWLNLFIKFFPVAGLRVATYYVVRSHRV